MNNTNRIEYIDILRGFAIFLVVLGHVLEKSGLADSTLFYLIYSFHMPLFICISAYVSAYVYHNKLFISGVDGSMGGGKFILRKFNAIMVPYLLWSLVVCPFFFNSYYQKIEYGRILDRTFLSNTSYWFLPCLFGLLVCYAVYKYIREQFKVRHILTELGIVLAIFMMVAALYKLSGFDFLRSVLSYYIPFWIGIFMGQYKRFESIITDNKAVFGVCLLIFCLAEGLFVGRMDVTIGKSCRLLCGLVALPVLFNIFKNMKLPTSLSSFAVIVGQSTLGIYLIHSLFLREMIVVGKMKFLYSSVIFSIVSFFLILLSLAIIYILNINPLARKVLLGK